MRVGSGGQAVSVGAKLRAEKVSRPRAQQTFTGEFIEPITQSEKK